jgi:hypothetical protein
LKKYNEKNKYVSTVALAAALSSGIVSACGAMDREIESGQGIHRAIAI